MNSHYSDYTNTLETFEGDRKSERASKKAQHLVSLLIGSNIEPEKNLPRAIRQLGSNLLIEQISSVWETPAVGSTGPDFLNVAVLIHTLLSPRELKESVLRPIESQLGRVRTADKFASRTIDIDIVTYDARLLDRNLWKYAHRSVPVSELLPWYQSDETGEYLKDAAQRHSQNTPIKARPTILLK